ncbi:MAG: DNA polymerase IV [Thermodesulfobacteriota bacterium]
MHVDMNAFFASVEQRCNPALRGKPIAVVGSAKRTVVTTASYEARAFGVKTGMNRYEAKRACPRLIFVIGNNRKYIDASVRMLDVLKGCSPCVEAYSIDEAFVDLAGCCALFPSLEALGRDVKARIRDEIGITCSVGIAPNKLLAKLASGMEKPDGLVLIGEGEVASLLEELPVGELWGIGPRLTTHLACLGVHTCGQLGRAPASVLRDRFGVIGERLKLMGQGIDPSSVVPIGEEAEARSVGHSMTLPADITDRRVVKRYLLKLSEMVGARARTHNLRGRKVALTLRYADFFTFSRHRTLPLHTNDTHAIYRSALAILASVRLRSAIRLLGVSISGLASGGRQMPLFEQDRRRERLLGAMDEINGHFGRFTLTWASLLEGDDSEPGVISPAWRPTGVKSVNVR